MDHVPYVVDLPMKDGDFPQLCGSLPEGNSSSNLHPFPLDLSLNTTGATDINTKLTPEVSTLNKGAAMLAMLHTPCEHQKNL